MIGPPTTLYAKLLERVYRLSAPGYATNYAPALTDIAARGPSRVLFVSDGMPTDNEETIFSIVSAYASALADWTQAMLG
jgi:hypothetical protein